MTRNSGDIVAPNLHEVAQAVGRAWSRETSADPAHWSAINPAWGQCAVTALVIQDMFGGELQRCVFQGMTHYWNRLPDGTNVDLTVCQFPQTVEKSGCEVVSREQVLSYSQTAIRYRRLLADLDVDRQLGGLPSAH